MARPGSTRIVFAFLLLGGLIVGRGAAASPSIAKPSAMNPVAQWIVWLGLGAVNALLLGVGGVLLVVVVVVLAIRIASRGDTMSAMSGLLIGFGATWLALMERQAASGGHLADAEPWLALGSVPIAVGALLGTLRLIRWGRKAFTPA